MDRFGRICAILDEAVGGQTWVDRLAPLRTVLPLGEWGWKIHFVDDQLGFVSLESFDRAAVLRTTDGGDTWDRIDVRDPQGNANLEGVGFLDASTGWVGGWGSATFEEGSSSATTDGGATWEDADEIGRFLNRFRFFRDPVPVGYASGDTVYRYSAEPAEALGMVAAGAPLRLLPDNVPTRTEVSLRLLVTVPDGAGALTVDAWDRFGEHVRTVADEAAPAPGPRTVEWDLTDGAGRTLSGSFVVRVTVDDTSESQIVHAPPLTPSAEQRSPVHTVRSTASRRTPWAPCTRSTPPSGSPGSGTPRPRSSSVPRPRAVAAWNSPTTARKPP